MSSVYSPFSDRVVFLLLNIPTSGGLMKSIAATELFYDRIPFLTLTTCMGYSIK